MKKLLILLLSVLITLTSSLTIFADDEEHDAVNQESQEKEIIEESKEPLLEETKQLFQDKQSDSSTSGQCGDSLYWSYDEETKVLEITGTGDMSDFTNEGNTPPWLEYVDDINEIVLPDGITSVGEYAFWNCESLHNINLPDSIKKIGKYAFYNCFKDHNYFKREYLNGNYWDYGVNNAKHEYEDNYYELTLPLSLTYIGDYAFANSNFVKGEIVISENVKYLGEGAFSDCNLESVVINANIENIKDYTFYLNRELSNITISNNIKNIGKHAFDLCHGKNITIGNAIENIDEYAFYGCTMENISFLSNVISIGKNAFCRCMHLKEMRFIGDMPSFGNECFYEDSLIIVYPKNNLTWNDEKFANYGGSIVWAQDGFDDVKCGENLTWSFDNETGELTISKIDSMLPSGGMYNYSSIINVAPWISHISEIRKVFLPEDITSIGDYAFWNCEKLIYIDMPNTIRYIGDYSLYNCFSDLEYFTNSSKYYQLVIPSSLEYIGDFAFCWSSKTGNGNFITNNIVIPNSVNYIGKSAFEGCYHVMGIDLRANIETINEKAFYATRISSIVIPDGVVKIDKNAFGSCGYLEDIEISDSVERIEEYAFNLCASKNVKLGKSVKYIGPYAFRSGKNCNHVFIFEGDMPTFYSNCLCDSAVNIVKYPLKNDTWDITKLNDFGNNFIWLENTNGEINNICGEHLTWKFDKQNKKLIIFGYGDMYQYSNVKNVVPWIDFISEIEEIELPDGLTSIEDYAFIGCLNLHSMSSIPSDLIKIGKCAFYNCFSDQHYFNTNEKYQIDIPQSLSYIGDYAFYNNVYICGSIEIPVSVEYLGSYAFHGCRYIDEYVIKANISEIKEQTFSSCMDTKSVVIDSDITKIGDFAFSGMSNIKELIIPNNVTSIGMYAFYNCSNLLTLTLPNSLKTINSNAFGDCVSLTEITIESINAIGDYAFRDCIDLRKIFFLDNIPTFGNNPFYNDTVTAYYPSNNNTWTKDKFQDYGGSIMWVAKKDLSNDTIRKFVVYANKNGNQIYAAVQDKSNYVIIDENGNTLEYVIDGQTQIIPYIGDIEMADMDEVKKGLYDGVLGKYHKSGYKLVDINYHVSKNNKKENSQNNAPVRLMAAPLLAEPVEDNNELAIISVLPEDVDGATYTIEVNNKDFIGSNPEIIGIGYDNEEFKVDSTYNSETGEITFKTNKFGTFIVVKDIKESKCSLKSSTLTLEDDIKVNLLFKIDDDVKTDETAYMLLRNTATNETKKIFVKDMPIKNDKSVASMSVVSKRIGDVIEAQLFVDDKPASEVFKYSGKQYIKTVLNPEYANASWNSEKLKEVCKALANYSSYSQIELSYNTESLTYNDVYMEDADKDVSDVDANTLSKYQATADGSVEGIAVSTAKLDLAAQTKCTLSFTLSGGHTKDEYTFTVNGKEVEPSESNGKLIIEFSSVAKKLGELVPITVTDNSQNTYTVNYCPLSYANQVVKSQTSDLYTETLKNVCRALYKYYVAADYYFTVSEQ